MRTNVEIAQVFERIATMLEIEGENPFRVRAYREAARVIGAHPEPVAAVARTPGGLESIRGIGKDLAQKIRDVADGGSTPLYEQLQLKVPLELVSLTELPGMGPKRVKLVFERLNVRNRDDLAAAVRAQRLRTIPGFGEAIERRLLEALAAAPRPAGSDRVLLWAAWPVATALAEHVRRVPGVERVEIAGSFRRGRETIGDLDLLASGGDPASVMEAFTRHPYVAGVQGRGESKASVRLGNGLQVDLRRVAPESFGAALLYFTGSKQHNIELRKIALDQGLTLNEYGLARGEERVAGRTEEEIYQALGLAWIPPEMREAIGEIELARANALPRLIEQADLAGDLHMHTDRSDGRDTIEAMLRAAKERGYAYLAITEHARNIGSGAAFDPERVRRSAEQVAEAARRVGGIEALHGLEVDIQAEGTLELPDPALALLDWTIVSLHGRFDQSEEAATARVLRALERPGVCVLGHPTGRKIGAREPVRLDLERIFRFAAERGIAMELNAQPDRMDLSDVNARQARDLGVRFVIDTDAHATAELDFMKLGVKTARRAWLTRDHVLNTRPFDAFERWRTARKAGASTGAAAKAGAAPAETRRKPTPAPARRKSPSLPAARKKSPSPAAGRTKSPSRAATPDEPRASRPGKRS